MADFSALIQRIKDAVYENGVQAITGQILQDCLKDVVNTVNVAKQDGIYRVTVTVDNNTGVPSATARMDDDTYTLEFSFHNLKGETGPQGPQGDTPVLTADSDGVIYSDGVMLTRVIKDTTDALTTRADSDHARAESDHARAETDHTDITRARGDAETAASEANFASLRANTAADNADAAREAIQSDLAAKQDVIPDLQQIRAGATDTVKYTSQSLTDAQKEQARTNIGAASDSEVSQLRSEKADKDGYYPEMSVGSLKGTEVTQVEGITTIAKSTGIAKINEVMGRSLVWNQLVSDSVTEVVVTSGHKYFSNIGGTKAIATSDGTAIAVTGGIDNIIDLTQLFGAGSEPSTVAEFESWLANNIGYRDYYAYNPGEIISNNTEALEITGLNQWDEEWEVGAWNANGTPSTVTDRIRSKNPIPILPNTSYYFKVGTTYFFLYLDADGNSLGQIYSKASDQAVIPPTGARYILFYVAAAYGTTYKHDICINVSGSRNGEYEPYQKSELELNLATITGKLNGEGESVTIFPEGMRSAGTAFDSLIVDEDGWCRRAVKRFEKVDLGSLNWTYDKNSQGVFSSGDIKATVGSCYSLCPKYGSSYTSARPASWGDKRMAINKAPAATSGYFDIGEIIVKDSAYTDAATFKAAMSGVPLIYELATPVEYVLDTPIQMTFQAKHGGVIRQLPENGSEPTTAPMRMSVTYALDAVSILSDLPENYVSKESLQAMLSAMQSAGLFSAYTMTFNESTGKYEFTFTANA